MRPVGHDDRFDYVIVGAGSAGCVLAERLSASGRNSVLLLEEGGSDRYDPLVAMPKGIAKLRPGSRHVRETEVIVPAPDGGDARETWISGRVLGGSSTVNGMIYSRGHPLDYDAWEKAAGPGWGWADMKHAFVALENHELGANEWRGNGGPLHVSTGTFRYPLAEAMIAAGEALGLPRRDDLNHPDLTGVGYYCHTIRRGARWSAARAFLGPARRRRNLTVRVHASVRRVVVAGGRAVGVEVRIGRTVTTVAARRSVILCAGTVGSPTILQRSGIGPAEQLRGAGIAVVRDIPEVGRNLREHAAIEMRFRLLGDPGLNRRFRGLGLVPDLLRYVLSRRGPITTGPYEVGAFASVGDRGSRPDVQLLMSGYTRVGETYRTEREPGFTVRGTLLQPLSRGTVTVVAADPEANPVVRMPWLCSPTDQRLAVQLIRYVRTYVRQSPLVAHTGAELRPGPAAATDDELLAAMRRYCTSGFHAVGTCGMGRDDTAVVDGDLRVRGVDGLRVVDCSVMPGLVSGNTNGPVLALAWRAAQLVLDQDR
ncbi:MAG TPA: GMC family oxidoreductase N-terminal domain-containing protein [Amycolatopsis sp.]|nr:GMC family oxidoreductase N-terminal domain-containing protein [Amycolatopsis sp.]